MHQPGGCLLRGIRTSSGTTGRSSRRRQSRTASLASWRRHHCPLFKVSNKFSNKKRRNYGLQFFILEEDEISSSAAQSQPEGCHEKCQSTRWIAVLVSAKKCFPTKNENLYFLVDTGCLNFRHLRQLHNQVTFGCSAGLLHVLKELCLLGEMIAIRLKEFQKKISFLWKVFVIPYLYHFKLGPIVEGKVTILVRKVEI